MTTTLRELTVEEVDEMLSHHASQLAGATDPLKRAVLKGRIDRLLDTRWANVNGVCQCPPTS